MFQVQSGGRFTRNIRRAKASEACDGQESADIRHTAPHSLDAEKVGHGFKNVFEVCKTESLRLYEIAASET